MPTHVHTYILMNIRIAKAFRTTSSEALCILAGTNPIIIKIDVVVKQYNIRRGKGSQKQLIDRELVLKNWNSRTGYTWQTSKSLKLKDIRTKQFRPTQTGARASKGLDLEWQYSLERNLQYN